METREAVKELIRRGKIRCVFVHSKNSIIGSPKVLEVLKDLHRGAELNADGDFLGTFVINGMNSSREYKTRRRPSYVNHRRERNLYHRRLKGSVEYKLENRKEAGWRSKKFRGNFNYANSNSRNISANSHAKSKGRCQPSLTKQNNKNNKVTLLKSAIKGKEKLSKLKPKRDGAKSIPKNADKGKMSQLAIFKKKLKGGAIRNKMQDSGKRESKKKLTDFIKIPKLMTSEKPDKTTKDSSPRLRKKKLQDYIRVPKFGGNEKQDNEGKKGIKNKLLGFTKPGEHKGTPDGKKIGEQKTNSVGKQTGETGKVGNTTELAKDEAGLNKARLKSEEESQAKIKVSQQGKGMESSVDAEKCPREDIQYQFDVDGTFQDGIMRHYNMPLYGNLAIGPGSRQYCCNNFAELQEHMLNNLIDALAAQCDCKNRRKIRKLRRRGMPWLSEELGDEGETSCSISRYLRRKERKVMGQLEVSNQFLKFAEIPPEEMLMYGLSDRETQQAFSNERWCDLPKGLHRHESHVTDRTSSPNCLFDEQFSSSWENEAR